VGYKRPAKLYDLRWADEPGLEVAVRPAPIGDVLDLMAMAEKVKGGDAAAIRDLLRRVASCLHSWNLEDDTGPVPATYEGLAGQDMDLVMKILTGWVRAQATVDTPLPSGSPNGLTSAPAPSIPMEPLSPRPPS
jgi:hypothetical protein